MGYSLQAHPYARNHEVSLTVNLFYHKGSLQTRIILEVTMENRKTLLEQIERLLALASETQLRILYFAALYLL